MNKERMKIVLEERIKMYRDSPGVPCTYVDMAQMCELMLALLGGEKTVGFKEKA